MSTQIELATILTAFLGITCISVSRAINRTFVSASTVFWMAWLGFTAAAWYCEWQGVLPAAISENATRLVNHGEVGAAAGCLTGSFLAGCRTGTQRLSERTLSSLVGPRSLYVWMAVMATVGTLYLLETLRHVGWNPLTLLFDIRMRYVQEGLTSLGKIAEYIAASTIVVAILLARRDAGSGIRTGPLVLLTCANVPLGFATGGRGFLITPVLYYTFAYLLARRSAPLRQTDGPLKRTPAWMIPTTLLVAALIFTGLGEWRWGTTSERPFLLRSLDSVLAYPAVSIASVSEYSEVFADTAAHGRLLVEWPAAQLERVGILSTDTRADEDSTRDAVFRLYGSPFNYPPTIIAYLIGDFGYSLMPIYFAGIMCIAQLISIRMSIRSLVGHSTVTLCLAGVFGTIQGASFFHSAHCLCIIWTVALIVLVKFGSLGTRRHEAVGVPRRAEP